MEDNCTVIKNEVTESPDLCNLEDIEEIFITSPKLEAEDHDDEYVRNYTTDLEGLSCNTEGSEQDIKPTLPEIEHFMAVTENSESHINNMFSNISNINGMTSVFSTNEAVASSGSSHDKKKAPSEGVCPFICDICGKYFSWKNSLKRHKKMHSDIRSYTCDICGKNYKTYPILVQHKRIHTGVRLYTCDICGKNFYQKTNLTSHKKIHADVFPFTCDICGKKFTYVGSLRSHKKLHIGVRPFTCDICGKNFIRKTHLTEHINVHTGVRPYVCDICGKSFKQIGGLTIHKKTHTGFKRFCCCEYDKIFGYKSSLEYHIRTVHLLDCTNRPSVQNTCQKKHNKETEDNHTKFEDNLQENPTVKQELNFPEFADNGNMKEEC